MLRFYRIAMFMEDVSIQIGWRPLTLLPAISCMLVRATRVHTGRQKSALPNDPIFVIRSFGESR
jgi:hypothetical protein